MNWRWARRFFFFFFFPICNQVLFISFFGYFCLKIKVLFLFGKEMSIFLSLVCGWHGSVVTSLGSVSAKRLVFPGVLDFLLGKLIFSWDSKFLAVYF